MSFNIRCHVLGLLLLLSASAVHADSAPATASFEGLDKSVAPGNDFYGYSNGQWLRSAQIPADRASYGVDERLAELNEKRIVDLIRQIEHAKPPVGSDARKVADYYDSFMDEAAIEARGLSVVKPVLDRIGGIADRAALAHILGSTLRADVDILNSTNLYTDNLFGVWIAQDLDDPTRYLPFLLQGGLGMPDRDYYLKDSPQMSQDRSQYQGYITAILTLAGEADADRKAADIFELEHKIAQTHASREQSEDVKSGDNHWTRAQIVARAPGLDWDSFFDGAGLKAQSEFVVWQPAAITGIASLVASEPLETWKVYLKFHELSHFANYLPKAFVEQRFAFYGKVLNGTPQLRERWKRAIASTNNALGDAVGKLYVERYFPPQAKAHIEDLVRHLLTAFSARIDDLQWMSPETKVKAKAKLAALKVGVGYPDHWLDYSAVDIQRGDAFGNVQRAELFQYQHHLGKLGKSVDRSEWVMVPQEVNAVNLPAMNALNFPAAILQSPYFDPKRPASMNYGAIGAIVGHEISHSFDDEGALFDASGRLQNWWTDSDFAHFKASAAQLVQQFNAYRPFPDLNVNGQQTLSENIADVAGLAAAYSAYQLSLQGRSAPMMAGFTGDQQFFLAFAQSWREKSREPLLRQQIVTDGHAPAQYRVDTVRNIDAWYPAFNVKPAESLYLAPDERVRMW